MTPSLRARRAVVLISLAAWPAAFVAGRLVEVSTVVTAILAAVAVLAIVLAAAVLRGLELRWLDRLVEPTSNEVVSLLNDLRDDLDAFWSWIGDPTKWDSDLAWSVQRHDYLVSRAKLVCDHRPAYVADLRNALQGRAMPPNVHPSVAYRNDLRQLREFLGRVIATSR
jgi:hypothetical protein